MGDEIGGHETAELSTTRKKKWRKRRGRAASGLTTRDLPTIEEDEVSSTLTSDTQEPADAESGSTEDSDDYDHVQPCERENSDNVEQAMLTNANDDNINDDEFDNNKATNVDNDISTNDAHDDDRSVESATSTVSGTSGRETACAGAQEDCVVCEPLYHGGYDDDNMDDVINTDNDVGDVSGGDDGSSSSAATSGRGVEEGDPCGAASQQSHAHLVAYGDKLKRIAEEAGGLTSRGSAATCGTKASSNVRSRAA